MTNPSIRRYVMKTKALYTFVLNVGIIFIYCNILKCSQNLDKTSFDSVHTTDLEIWIDKYTEELPKLSNFILPVS